MATVIGKEYARTGGGDRNNTFNVVEKRFALTMAAGATVTAQFNLPPNAALSSAGSDVPTAFSGTPTNINLSIGTAAAGAQVVAATDIKAQAHTALTLVAAFDNNAVAANGFTPIYLTLAAVGGTAPAGTAYVHVRYSVPAP